MTEETPTPDGARTPGDAEPTTPLSGVPGSSDATPVADSAQPPIQPPILPPMPPPPAGAVTAPSPSPSSPPSPPSEATTAFPWITDYGQPGFGQPGFGQPAPAPAAAPKSRRRGAGTAALLASALLIGGGAGIGGAAWFDAWKGDDASPTSSMTSNSGTTLSAADAADLPAGTVEKVAATVLPSVVKINVASGGGSGSGSGIILSSDGNILTNNHVVQVAGNQGSITVNFNNGNTVKATIVGTDPVTDLAVIKAQGVSDLPAAKIGKSDELRVGQSVVAVGSPYGLSATVTSGIVSALNRAVSVQRDSTDGQQPSSTTYPAVQTDAAINPGNSGGPLVDLAGQVVGINSSIRTSGASLTGSGGSIGLGFAIPIDEALPIVQQILDGETPTHARLAVTVSDVRNSQLAQGAVLESIESGGAADRAGLRKGDVITKVDDLPIDSSESLVATIRGHRPGDKVTITYLRGGNQTTTTATLGSDAETSRS